MLTSALNSQQPVQPGVARWCATACQSPHTPPVCSSLASAACRSSQSLPVRSPQIRSSSRSSGTPRGLLAAACVCARVGARARACEQACVFVHERARANTQPRTDQDPRFRRQVYDKQKGNNDLKIYTARGPRHQWSCVCACSRVRARVRACVLSEIDPRSCADAARTWYGWIDACTHV